MAVTKRKLSYYDEKGIDDLKDLSDAYIPAFQSNANNFKIPAESFFDTFPTKEEITKIPNVEITSEDSSVKVTETTDVQANTKKFDLSVNVDDQLEYGQFRATDVTSQAQLTKIKGNLELDNYAIKLKKGNSYHFTVRGSYVATDTANTYATITYIEYSSFNGIQINVDNTITDEQFFEISYDVYNFSQKGNYNVSFASITGGKVSELWVEVHNLNGVSINGGSGTTYTAGDAIDLTNDTISVNTDIIATKESVDDVKENLVNINKNIDTLSNTISNIGEWEDISSKFTATSVITDINKAIIRLNRALGLIYINIDISGNFYRTSTSSVTQLLFNKSKEISDLTFPFQYGIFYNDSNGKMEMPYQMACTKNGIVGWLPEGYSATYVLVTAIIPLGI